MWVFFLFTFLVCRCINLNVYQILISDLALRVLNALLFSHAETSENLNAPGFLFGNSPSICGVCDTLSLRRRPYLRVGSIAVKEKQKHGKRRIRLFR